MSYTSGILALVVWLFPNEVAVNGFLLWQIWCLEARHRDMLTETRRIALISSDYRFPSLDMEIKILPLAVITCKVL